MAKLDRPSPRFERRIREVERRILGSQLLKNHQYLLEKIERAGMPQNNLVRALALVVTHHQGSSSQEWWREAVRTAISRWESLAKRLETTAELTDEVTKYPFHKIELWTSLWGALLGDRQMPNLAQSLPALWTISGMRFMAKSARQEARALGNFLRTASRKDDRFPVMAVLSAVRSWTKQDFDEELSTLLNDAFTAVDKKPSLRITPENLRQLRSRYLSHQS